MGRLLGLVTAVLLWGSVGGAAAATHVHSYDRPPAKLYGLTPDGWGQTTTAAESQLFRRYRGIRSGACIPVIMIGHEADSSSVNGLSRYWDKLACGGHTLRGFAFTLIYDQKTAGSWIIYRLTGVGPSALVYG